MGKKGLLAGLLVLAFLMVFVSAALAVFRDGPPRGFNTREALILKHEKVHILNEVLTRVKANVDKVKIQTESDRVIFSKSLSKYEDEKDQLIIIRIPGASEKYCVQLGHWHFSWTTFGGCFDPYIEITVDLTDKNPHQRDLFQKANLLYYSGRIAVEVRGEAEEATKKKEELNKAAKTFRW